MQIFTLTSLLFFAHSSIATTFYSVASLILLCGSKSSGSEIACDAYIQGVIETWMSKDVIAVNPYKFKSQNDTPIYCEAINSAPDGALVDAVKSSLNTMQPGLAADAVMLTISKKYCK